ncbi:MULTISPECIES: hypothetical protein [Streptomyces]|uniref:hypothetical protein n=1 Tax=Streptomyces TaxID=1883 RepID=UPI0029B42D76|nr:hypothetical protein [Streptomyces stelliscabiei]MDX2520545.1 hypothetical protein [Streptomyces stelliscabiei]MDX2552642.1 hypothetical protein [Streptomyces stelliscabiei]MDX2661326.1 hypothetical protein [Streptomyces stelliscabiei]MDX2788807.1 hypothetical protein [Streptomyces stelliscabiei]
MGKPSAEQIRDRQVWNGGMVGPSRKGDDVPLFHKCKAPGCTRCAAIDRALTDLRTNGRGGETR